VTKHTFCLQCGSDNLNPVSHYHKAGLVRCESCSFVFCDRIPTQSELIAHYNTYPRHDTISDITIKRYQELANKFEFFRENNKWLDVGCGNGHMLFEAKKLNWDVYGTEFTDRAVEICSSKGIKMNQGELNISNYQEGQFDIITFVEVIEHINSPNKELSDFHYLLRKGGLLYITTPNFNSISRNLLKENWSIIEYPEHLCYYTAKTLHNALVRNGFEKLDLQTTGISVSRISKNHNNNHTENKSKDESLRNLTENKTWAKKSKTLANSLLNLLKKGDTLKALYIKK
jgi:2-polyprenyl-3-methyl-5-hydroxy-6-metoxy-1,4-benzoquinol methylase